MAWYSANGGTIYANFEQISNLYANDNGDGTWSLMADTGGRTLVMDHDTPYDSQAAALAAAATLVSPLRLP